MASPSGRRAILTLPADTQIRIRREFDAPCHLIYRAWTTPDLIRLWWAGDHGEVTSAEVDLRVGGRWRNVMRARQGFEVAFHGEYREVVPDARIVSTEVYEGFPEAEAVSTLTLTRQGDGTLLEILIQHTSPAHRDAHIQSGMEAGLQEALQDLDQLTASLQA